MKKAHLTLITDCGFFECSVFTNLMHFSLPSTKDHAEFVENIENLLQWLADQGCEEITIQDSQRLLADAA